MPEMKTAKIRQSLVKVFTRVLNNLHNEQLKILKKDQQLQGFSDFTVKSRQEQIQIVKDRIDDLSREELIRLSEGAIGKLGLIIDK